MSTLFAALLGAGGTTGLLAALSRYTKAASAVLRWVARTEGLGNDAVPDLLAILEEQRRAYSHLSEQLEESTAEIERLRLILQERGDMMYLLEEALAVATRRIEELEKAAAK